MDRAAEILTDASGPTPVAPTVKAARDIARNRFTAAWRPVADARGYRLDVSNSRLFKT